jgi:phosphomannomutase
MLFALCKSHTISEEVTRLPKRFTQSDRLKDFPLELSKGFIAQLKKEPQNFLSLINESFKLKELNDLDGIRITLQNEDVIHIRPSGNAPELRCYVESTSSDNAQRILKATLAQLELLK